MAGVARAGEAVLAGADSGGGGAASSFDWEFGGSVLIDGAGAEESGGVSGGVLRDPGRGSGGEVGDVAGGDGRGREGAGASGDCDEGLGIIMNSVLR